MVAALKMVLFAFWAAGAGRNILMRKLEQPFRYLGDYFYHKAIPLLSSSFVMDALRIMGWNGFYYPLSLDTPKIHNLR